MVLGLRVDLLNSSPSVGPVSGKKQNECVGGCGAQNLYGMLESLARVPWKGKALLMHPAWSGEKFMRCNACNVGAAGEGVGGGGRRFQISGPPH